MPEITPVDVFMLKPVGRVGEIAKLTAPVKFEVVNAVEELIADPEVADTVWDVGLMVAGGVAETTIVIVAVATSDPTVLSVAVIV